MKIARSIRLASILVTALVATSAPAASKAERDQMMSYDGLERINVKGIDLAYARPGASLADYTKVKLDPIEIAFAKNWNPTKPVTRSTLTADERESIRSGIAKIVYDAFVREVQTKGGYAIVDTAGPDVLRVKASIINVYVTAPDILTPGRTRTYTVTSGEGTIFAELFDSESGEILARVTDRREARNSGYMLLSSSVFNAAEADRLASAWARILRARLDAAHTIDSK